MRLTLDDLKVAESAARAWPQGHYGPYAGKLPCVAEAVKIFSSGGGAAGTELALLLWAMNGVDAFALRFAEMNPQQVHGQMFGMLMANPTYLADCIKQVIDAAGYQPTVKKDVTSLRRPAITAAATAILRESKVQRATSGLASSQPESPRTAEAATT